MVGSFNQLMGGIGDGGGEDGGGDGEGGGGEGGGRFSQQSGVFGQQSVHVLQSFDETVASQLRLGIMASVEPSSQLRELLHRMKSFGRAHTKTPRASAKKKWQRTV